MPAKLNDQVQQELLLVKGCTVEYMVCVPHITWGSKDRSQKQPAADTSSVMICHT